MFFCIYLNVKTIISYLISDGATELKMEYKYRSINGSEESFSIYNKTGVVYETGKSYSMSVSSIVENNELTNTIVNNFYADLTTNTRYSVVSNQLEESTRYDYGSAANDMYLNLTLTNGVASKYEAQFYRDYFPVFTMNSNNGSFYSTLIYNLAYIDGWTEYLYDNETYLIKENDNVLLGDNPRYVVSPIGGFINVRRHPLSSEVQDIELNVEGLTMPSLNWLEVKDTISNLDEQYFLNLSNQLLDPSQVENIDLVLDSPYE